LEKISVEDIDKNDVEFITQLPKQYNDIQVALGRYGLYMIFKNKNYRLPKNEWENVKNNTIMYSQLKNYI
jgi:topoisomerase IA-like protein